MAEVKSTDQVSVPLPRAGEVTTSSLPSGVTPTFGQLEPPKVSPESSEIVQFRERVKTLPPEEQLKLFNALVEEGQKQQKLRLGQLDLFATALVDTLAEYDEPKSIAGKYYKLESKVFNALGLGKTLWDENEARVREVIKNFIEKDYPEIQRRILAGEEFENIVKDNKALQLVIGSTKLNPKRPKNEPELKNQLVELVNYYRSLSDYNKSEQLCHSLLNDKLAPVVERLDEATQKSLLAKATKTIQPIIEEQKKAYKNPTPEQIAKGVKPLEDGQIAELKASMIMEEYNVLAKREAAKKLDPKTLNESETKAWQVYNEAFDPKGEWLNLSDENRTKVNREIAINVPMLMVSGGTANIAKMGVSGVVRAGASRYAAKELALAGIEQASKESVMAVGKELLAKNLASRALVAGGELLAEGTVFEATHLGLQGEKLWEQPDWAQRIFWSCATLGMIHGGAQLGNAAFKSTAIEGGTAAIAAEELSKISNPALKDAAQTAKLGEKVVVENTKLGELTARITNKPVRELTETLLLKGHAEAAAMMLAGAAQQGCIEGKLDPQELWNNLPEDALHTYLTLGALKVGHKVTGSVAKALTSNISELALEGPTVGLGKVEMPGAPRIPRANLPMRATTSGMEVIEGGEEAKRAVEKVATMETPPLSQEDRLILDRVKKSTDEWEMLKLLKQISVEGKRHPETQEAAKSGLIACLSNGWTGSAQKLIDQNILSEEQVQEAAIAGLTECLGKGRTDSAQEILNLNILSEDQVQEAAKIGLAEVLKGGGIEFARYFLNQNILNEEQRRSPEIQEAAKEQLRKMFLECKDLGVKRILELDILNEQQVQEVAKTSLIESLEPDGTIGSVRSILDLGVLNEQQLRSADVQEKAKERLVDYLKQSHGYAARYILDLNLLNNEQINSPEMREAAKIGLAECFSYGDCNVREARDILRLNILSKEQINSPDVQELAAATLIKSIGRTDDRTTQILELNILSDEALRSSKFQESLQSELVRAFSNVNEQISKALPKVQKILNLNILTEERIHSKEVREAAKALLGNRLRFTDDVKDVDVFRTVCSLGEDVGKTVVTGLNRGGYSLASSPQLFSALSTLPEIQQAAKALIIEGLDSGDGSDVQKLVRFGLATKTQIESTEVQEAAKSAIIKCFEARDNRRASENIQKLNILSEEQRQVFSGTPKVQQVIETELHRFLWEGFISDFQQIVGLKLLSDDRLASICKTPEMKDTAREGLLNCIKGRQIGDFQEIQKLNILSQAELQALYDTPEMQEATKAQLVNSLDELDIGRFEEIQDLNILSGEQISAFDKTPEMQEAAERQLLLTMENGNLPSFEYLLWTKIVSNEQLQALYNTQAMRNAAESGFVSSAEKRDFEGAKYILSQNILMGERAREVVRDRFDEALKNGDIGIINQICDYEILDKPTRELWKKTYNTFGEQVTVPLWNAVCSLVAPEQINEQSLSEAKESLQELGIKKSGYEGVQELRGKLNELGSKLHSGDIDYELVRRSMLVRDFLKKMTRYESSEWGRHGSGEFYNILAAAGNNNSTGVSNLRPGYEESGTIRLAKKDKKAMEEFKFSDAFRETYNRSVVEAKEAVAMAEDASRSVKVVSEIFADGKTLIEGLVAESEKKRQVLASADNPNAKAVDSISKQIEQYRSIRLSSVQDIFDNLSLLEGKDPVLDSKLRKFLMWGVIDKHSGWKGTIAGLDRGSLFDGAKKILELYNHAGLKETWTELTEKGGNRASLGRLLKLGLINDEVLQAEKQDVVGTTTLDFVPTRGLLMELSGHLADACWASKYDSIATQFPNFTAVTMVQNRGTLNERLCGSSMLIETKAKDGTLLLVIRGLNPIENTINELKPEEFVGKYVEYVRSLAEKQGRKVAIVIDDYSGGAATNRPSLFEYLSSLKAKLQKVQLNSSSDTTFNGYDITDDVYLI